MSKTDWHSEAVHLLLWDTEYPVYDQATPFSLMIDAGSMVILANGDPVYRYLLPRG